MECKTRRALNPSICRGGEGVLERLYVDTREVQEDGSCNGVKSSLASTTDIWKGPKSHDWADLFGILPLSVDATTFIPYSIVKTPNSVLKLDESAFYSLVAHLNNTNWILYIRIVNLSREMDKQRIKMD